MERPNVVLIVVDCLREDHAGPVREALEPLGFRSYPRAVSTAPWTLPSHTSMFTGLYPSAHGVHETRTRKLPNILFDPSLDNVLDSARDRNYQLCWLTSNPGMTPNFRFPEPDFYYFHHYEGSLIFSFNKEEVRYSKEVLGKLNTWQKGLRLLRDGKLVHLAKRIGNRLLRPLKRRKDWPLEKGGSAILRKLQETDFEEPHFVFMNLMEVHEPYPGIRLDQRAALIDGREWGEETRGKLRAAYRREVEHTAGMLREMVKALDDGNTLFVVTADHGNLLGEKLHLFHRWGLEQGVLRVPLLIKHPAGEVPQGDGWLSLKKLHDLFMGAMDGVPPEDVRLYAPAAFAEEFGNRDYNPFKTRGRMEKAWLERMNQHRIAMFWRDSFSVYNADTESLDRVEMLGNRAPSREGLEKRFRSFLELL